MNLTNVSEITIAVVLANIIFNLLKEVWEVIITPEKEYIRRYLKK